MLGELHRLGREDGAEPVQGLADAVDDPAKQTHAHRDAVIFGDGHHPGAGNDPLSCSLGIKNRRSPANPTTSASRAPSWVSMRHREPMAARQPMASRVNPTTRVSLPATGGGGLLANPVAFKPIKKGCRHVASDDECLMMPSAGRCTTGSNRAMAQLALSRRKLRSS